MTTFFWILAFLGVGLIYGGDKLVKRIVKAENTEKTESLVKLLGCLLSVAALAALFVTGSFK